MLNKNMKRIAYTTLLIILFLMLTACLLIYPSLCLTFALTGLNLWFQKMVPTLLPFMILSGIMIRMNLTEKIVFLVRPLLQPFFRLRPAPLYAIIVGFLCGFPMGARVVADLYSRHKITKAEASYLLAFCNNIGPIYFTGFVLTTLSLKETAPYLLGMYGLPLLYGIFLRHTFYARKLNEQSLPADAKTPASGLLEALDDSITAGMEGITKLGGYMIFFNLLNIIPLLLLGENHLSGIFNCFLEITSGIQFLGNSNPAAVLILVSFGGLSCLAQTNSCIRHTDLSIKSYILHKLMLTVLASLYYGILFF